MLRISQDFGYPNAIVKAWLTNQCRTEGESAGGPQTIMPDTLFARSNNRTHLPRIPYMVRAWY